MKFTDFFIKRPIVAFSIILLIMLFGIQALGKLTVRQYPKIVTTVITVTTDYPGASQNTMQAAITSVLEKAIAEASNIQYISTSTVQGVSTITVKMDLNTNPSLALAAISAQVNGVLNELPSNIYNPVISESSGPTGIIYYTLSSKKLSTVQLYSYANRVIEPELQSLSGVSSVDIYGPSYAFRIWIDPKKLVEMHVSAAEVKTALEDNNLETQSGTINGWYTYYSTDVKTTANSPKALEQLVISSANGKIIRLGDIASVSLQRKNNSVLVYDNGLNAIAFGINTTPEANSLTVSNLVAAKIIKIKKALPAGINLQVMMDKATSIKYGIHDVIEAVFEAIIIVLFVILLFLGSIRAMIIPVVAIPVSLVGAIALLDFMGYSYNLITLLAMIIAVGLVVDDAIVVVENIDRHLKLGESSFKAAILGTREIALPVITMTVTLCSVFTPMVLVTGLTGILFKQFVVTLIGAILLSGVVALVLSPVLSSKVLKEHSKGSRFEHAVTAVITKITNGYKKSLHISLNNKKYVIGFAVIVLVSVPVLFSSLNSETMPNEDQGMFLAIGNTSGNRNPNYVEDSMISYAKLLNKIPQIKSELIIAGKPSTNQAMVLGSLVDWSKRSKNLTQITNELNAKAKSIPGINIQGFAMPTINTGSQGFPVQFVMSSTDSLRNMEVYALKLLNAAEKSGQIAFPQLSLKFNTGLATITINRNLANTYGIKMSTISSLLSIYLSDDDLEYNTYSGQSYPLITGIVRAKRLNPNALNKLEITTSSGTKIPLGSIIKIKVTSQPASIANFNQLNSITLSGIPTTSIGSSISWLNKASKKIFPNTYTFNYLGESLQYVQAGNTMMYIFLLAIGVIFLVLAIQFESFRDALVILFEVPLAISGALLVLNIFSILGYAGATLNLYSEMGLLALIGLIAKHGILICEVAKENQLKGLTKFDAIVKAAEIRFRPVLMTTAAMVAGLIPLLYGFGPTTVAKFSIGIVLIAGLSIGTLFTLFVLPVLYLLIATRHKPKVYDI
ncbi:MAG: efflux RND transporter permease subunit [Psittacicella sp.]